MVLIQRSRCPVPGGSVSHLTDCACEAAVAQKVTPTRRVMSRAGGRTTDVPTSSPIEPLSHPLSALFNGYACAEPRAEVGTGEASLPRSSVTGALPCGEHGLRKINPIAPSGISRRSLEVAPSVTKLGPRTRARGWRSASMERRIGRKSHWRPPPALSFGSKLMSGVEGVFRFRNLLAQGFGYPSAQNDR